MGFAFHETVMGRRFYEGQLPKLIKALEKIADNMGDKPHGATTPATVYVCYHENSPELSIENPVVNQLTVAYSLEEVKGIVTAWIEAAKTEQYVPLNDFEQVQFFNDIMTGRNTALPLYYKQDENSRLYYSLTVKQSFETVATEEK